MSKDEMLDQQIMSQINRPNFILVDPTKLIRGVTWTNNDWANIPPPPYLSSSLKIPEYKTSASCYALHLFIKFVKVVGGGASNQL